jgi:Leucine-rich repeat (LRR) protein
MALMVILFMLLHLTTKQVSSENKTCSIKCKFSDTGVVICNEISTGEDILEGEKFGNSVKKLEMCGNNLTVLNNNMFSECDLLLLQSVNLSNNSITEIKKFAFYGLAELEYLDISGNKITSVHNETFVTNPNLTFLSLACNKLETIHEETFSGLGKLQHLNLSDNSITSIPPKIFGANENLESLRLASNKLTIINSSTFQNQSNLIYLDLSGNRITKIEGGTFNYTTILKSLLLANNILSELHPSAFHEDNQISYMDISGNRIEKLENLTFYQLQNLSVSRNVIRRLGPRNFSNCTELLNLVLSENNISEISSEAFYGLEKLEYLDLSSNNITNISSFVFQDMLHQTEVNTSESVCVSKMKFLNLAKNKIYSFNFKEYLPLKNSHNISFKFCELKVLNLSQNCLSTLDDMSMSLLRNSTVLTYLSDNPWSCECSLSQIVYKELNENVTLKCATSEYLKAKTCIALKDPCQSSMSPSETASGTEIEAQDNSQKEGENEKFEKETQLKGFLETHFIFVSYVFTVCVAIVVVLIITCAVGEPEPDEFWWEDKLAKRNEYY